MMLRGQRGDGVLGQPKALADLADRASAAVGDDGGRQPGPVAAVFGVDVLDHLLAALVLEIDVDVGRLVALLGDEALEQEVDPAGSTSVMPRQ
jgi:carbon monoxide dehydrogenase subunit G